MTVEIGGIELQNNGTTRHTSFTSEGLGLSCPALRHDRCRSTGERSASQPHLVLAAGSTRDWSEPEHHVVARRSQRAAFAGRIARATAWDQRRSGF